MNITAAKAPLSYHKNGNHLQYSNHFQLNIASLQPGAVSCKWLCEVANNGCNSKDDALSRENSAENSLRIT